VCALQHALNAKVGVVGAIRRGRWRPDLPAPGAPAVVALTSTLLEDGVKILGGGSCPTNAGGSAGTEPFLHVVTADGVAHTIYPRLLASLASLATFRTRDWQTLMVLRNRALGWVKEVGMRDLDVVPGFASTIVMAMAVGSSESAAVESSGALGLSACFAPTP